MINWVVNGLGGLFGFIGKAAGSVSGWAWDKVVVGIYTWLANGLALLIQWVWGVLDSASTPRVTDSWFRNGLAAQLGVIALAVTIAMMLASAMQAALAGRPEQIVDATKEGVRAVVASAVTLTVIDVLVRITDEAAAMVWHTGRPDVKTMIERLVKVATVTGPLSHSFIGPLCLLLGFVGLLGLVVSLMMRSALIYVAAALAPLVWSSSVLPSMRGSARKLVHLTVSLIVSKLAIVVTLVIAVKLLANAGATPKVNSTTDGATAVGMLVSSFVCFIIAAVTPVVLFKLMPTVEGAMVASGVAGGWGRSASGAASSALMVKSLGTSKAASAATRAVSGQGGVSGSGPSDTAGGGGPGERGSSPSSDGGGSIGGASRAAAASFSPVASVAPSRSAPSTSSTRPRASRVSAAERSQIPAPRGSAMTSRSEPATRKAKPTQRRAAEGTS